jgi:hypothetical protein
MSIFFIGASVLPQIKGVLRKRYLTPVVIKYNTLEHLPIDKRKRLNNIGESFAQDFCAVISLANSVNLALTREKSFLKKVVL